MNDDKECGGSLGSGDFRQNTTSPHLTFNRSCGGGGGGSVPLPHELTAEWTVRAQLTFTRAGENVRKEFSHSDPVHPVRVVYKWSTFESPGDDGANIVNDDDNNLDGDEDDNCDDRDDDDDIDEGERHLINDKGDVLSYSTPFKKKKHINLNRESFRSTTSSTNPDNGGGDSAFSGSTTSRKQNHSPYDNVKQKKKTTTTSTTTRNATTADIGGDGTDPSSTAIYYGTRCRSTCNIVVSAVADFLPSSSNNTSFNSRGGAASSSHQSIPEEPDPFVFNTTASYTVLPEKSVDESNLASKNFSTFGKILDLRDAICQTSDPETNYHESKIQRCSNDGRCNIDRRQLPQHKQRNLNEHNCPLESTLLQPASMLEEGNSLSPSITSPPSKTRKSASLPRIPPLPALGQSSLPLSQSLTQSQPSQKLTEQQKKPPRTVHIDVYCTGSDEEDDADNDATSSASSPGVMNPHEIESNSTPQTVLNTEQMLLRHHRVSGKALPRRMILNQNRQGTPFVDKSSAANSMQTKNNCSMAGLMNLGHAITKSNTIDEVNESKQLLLRKHVGDQRAVKLQNLRSKYLQKDSNDDCLSSNYPNSSRSTMRDATCSSISSIIQSPAVTEPDFATWKEPEDIDSKCSLAKSDSFEYDNSVDRLRIKQMERFWSQAEDDISHATGGDYNPHMLSTFLHPISEVNPIHPSSGVTVPNEMLPFESINEEGATSPTVQLYRTHAETYPSRVFSPKPPTPTNLNPSTFLHYFGPQASASGGQQQQQQNLLPGHFRYRPTVQRWRSEIPDTPSSISEDTNTSNSPTKRCGSETRSIEKKFDIPMQRSNEAPPAMMTGYTQEYLEKARIFGPVMQVIRKPGHHIGPTKNPTCLCSSCQRWLAERVQMRARAHSVGEKMMIN